MSTADAPPGEFSNRNSPEQKALSVSELLDNIFSFSSQNSCARFVRVNKQWFDGAVSYVWARLDTLQPLSRLLPDAVIDGGNSEDSVRLMLFRNRLIV